MRFAAIVSVFASFLLGSVTAGDVLAKSVKTTPFIFGSNGTSAVDPAALKGRAVGNLEKRGYNGILSHHDMDTNTLVAKVAEYDPNQWRIISISVSGDVTNPRYAAIWAHTPSPAWLAIANATLDHWQSFWQSWQSEGYVPTLISVVSGSTPDNAIVAGVLEKKNIGSFTMDMALTTAQMQAKVQQVLANGRNYKPIAMSFYGSGDPDGVNARYALLMHQDNGSTQWGWRQRVHADDYRNSIAASDIATNALPFIIAGSSCCDGKALSIFVQASQNMPKPFVFGSGRSSAEYQQYFNSMTGQGYQPFSISVSGTGASSIYWSSWTK